MPNYHQVAAIERVALGKSRLSHLKQTTILLSIEDHKFVFRSPFLSCITKKVSLAAENILSNFDCLFLHTYDYPVCGKYASRQNTKYKLKQNCSSFQLKLRILLYEELQGPKSGRGVASKGKSTNRAAFKTANKESFQFLPLRVH